MRHLIVLWLGLPALLAGCAEIIEPGHRGLLFNPRHGGLQHEVLGPGRHWVGTYGRIDDFDTTYSTRKEEIHTVSVEGLTLELRLQVIFRPVISELYELDTEIGRNYYEEVVGPEFRSAARGVLAHHSYQELLAKNQNIEDEIEVEVRRRVSGKHVEISSITLEQIDYPEQITASIRDRLVGEQEALRRKTTLESDALREQLALKHDAEKAHLRAEQEVASKQHEREIAEQQAAIDKVKAEAAAEVKVTNARAEAEEATLLAKAHAEEQRAQNHTLTPLAVMDHAYEALAKMGGEGTMVMLGDWSKVPNFLFPQSLLHALGGAGSSGGSSGGSSASSSAESPKPDAAHRTLAGRRSPTGGPHTESARPSTGRTP